MKVVNEVRAGSTSSPPLLVEEVGAGDTMTVPSVVIVVSDWEVDSGTGEMIIVPLDVSVVSDSEVDSGTGEMITVPLDVKVSKLIGLVVLETVPVDGVTGSMTTTVPGAVPEGRTIVTVTGVDATGPPLEAAVAGVPVIVIVTYGPVGMTIGLVDAGPVPVSVGAGSTTMTVPGSVPEGLAIVAVTGTEPIPVPIGVTVSVVYCPPFGDVKVGPSPPFPPFGDVKVGPSPPYPPPGEG